MEVLAETVTSLFQRLLPLTSKQPLPSTTPDGPYLDVVRYGQETHLLIQMSQPNEFAYRQSFEFADETRHFVSALVPENAPREVSGWESILPKNNACRVAPAHRLPH